MIAVQVARIIANFILFLDLEEDDVIDADDSVAIMEKLGGDLQVLDKNFLRRLSDAFAVIAPEYDGDAYKIVMNIPRDFYLEEALAAGDPLRLAELEARREAED